ncbi:hypothetical protein AGMMS49982_12780 [Bacteroidia bacterium]|nr:hypothetical protein AGMMS49982_12780 [Bacteroidia bacterium]
MNKIFIMNKIFCIAFITVAFGCIPEFQPYQEFVTIKLVQQADKQIILDLSMAMGTIENHVLRANHANDKDSVSFSRVVKYSMDDFSIGIDCAKLYNISDTTSIVWSNSDIWNIYSRKYDLTDTELLYKQVWNITFDEKSSNSDDIYDTYILSPNDELFTVMQKDYAMLEKFSEYYQQ